MIEKLIHTVTRSEIFYGIISIGTTDKYEFYNKLPPRFSVKVKKKIVHKRKLGLRKITLGKGIMTQFEPKDVISMQIIDNMLVIELFYNHSKVNT